MELDMNERKPDPCKLLKNSLSGTQSRSLGIDVRWSHCLKPSQYPEHSHTEIQIAVPLSDARFVVNWQTDTGSHQRRALREFDVLVIPAEQSHQITVEQEADWVVFDVKPGLLVSAAYESVVGDRIEIVEQYGMRDSFIAQLAVAFREEAHAGNSSSHLYVDSLATLLAVHIARRYSDRSITMRSYKDGLPRAKLNLAREYIEQHLEDDITVGDLAQVVAISPYHFSRLFRQSAGLSPYKYIIKRRIDRAKQLLGSGDMPLSHIAVQLGFSSQSHFAQTFRQHTGMTPRNYRG